MHTRYFRNAFTLIPDRPMLRRLTVEYFSMCSSSPEGSMGHQRESEEVKRKGSVGLYGYDVLKSAKGFEDFAQQAIEKSEELINCIRQLPPSMEIIRAFDDLSDTICAVVDSAELCRNTHPDMEFVNAASRASMRMYEYLHCLNTNPALYNALVRAEKLGVLTTEEAKRAAETLRTDFDRGGIHLPKEQLQRVHELNLEITLMGREFINNIVTDPGHVDFFPASKLPKRIRNLHQPIFKSKDGNVIMLSRPNSSAGKFFSGVRVITEPANLASVLQWAEESEVRKEAYMQGYSVPKSNLLVLDKIIAARHEFAQLLGYKSFAKFIVAPTLAASPDVVKSFLVDMSTRLRGRADEEWKMMENFRKEIEGDDCQTVNAWDEAYYMGLLKARSFDISPMVVAAYFPLAQCIEGLRIIVESLFGATFHQAPLDPGESWHPDVQKLTLHHNSEGNLGHLYLDLYSREGKFPGSAHFAIKGGRRLSHNDYQLPVVALVCNFSNAHDGSPPLLSHVEIETFFHEFGHALHSLLSRTEYQHFSGTRTVIDFAEIPSHLFEYYAWDYRVLSRFAKHFATGEVIPKKVVESLNRARNLFAATELQRQILYAMTDQILFGEQPLPGKDTTSVVAELKQLYTGCKHVNGTHWHTRFNHFITYGAAYYSYLYAKCFAASIWQKICNADPLSLEAGEVLRKELLQYGGARDPAAILRGCLGDGAIISCSDGIRPTISDLLEELKI